MTDKRKCWVDAISKLDGVAAVNLAEPSKGDLERVVNAYRECREERDQLRKEIEQLKVKLHEASMRVPTTNTGWPYEKKLHERIERLERALEHAKAVVLDSRFEKDIQRILEGKE